MSINYKEASTKALDAVRAIVMAEGVNTDQGETIERAMVKLLSLSWADAVRAEWQTFLDRDPELKAQYAVGQELMKEDQYGDLDPICMMPGQKATIAKVDNLEAVCVDVCMAQVMPLSAIYVDKVRTVQSAAARATKRLADEAVKEDPKGGWPIKTAAGEIFNSIDDMKASPNQFIRGLAESMEKATEEREKYAARIFNDAMGNVDPTGLLTCWQYFGMDGPVSLPVLAKKYRETVLNADRLPTAKERVDLASEAHRQYQNCLREIGAAIMNGAPSDETGG